MLPTDAQDHQTVTLVHHTNTAQIAVAGIVAYVIVLKLSLIPQKIVDAVSVK